MLLKRLKHFLTLLIVISLVVLGLFLLAKSPYMQYKIKFENEATLIPNPSNKWELEQELLVWVNDHLLLVPARFVTDLASIPWILQWKYNPEDISLIRPAILHDYLYQDPNGFSRAEADTIFYDALRVEGNSWFDSYAMYSAVRLFGWYHYAP